MEEVRFGFIAPRSCRLSVLLCLLTGLAAAQLCPSGANNLCVTTWQQDSGTDIGSGYAYRTGENLLESTITYSSIQTDNFGQLCSSDSANTSPLDGQIYSQPLVLTNVKINGQTYAYNMAYVVTQNDTLYAIDGKNCVVRSQYPFLQHAPMTGQSAVDCTDFPNSPCGTIYPTVGILGTPVIDQTAGIIYLVTHSIDSSGNFYHYLHALDVQSLTEEPNSPVLICPPVETCPSAVGFSFLHIQRPGLLLANCGSGCGNKNYVYVAFSMMDGVGSPYPNGAIFAYDASDLGAGRKAYFQTSLGRQDKSNGGGIWMGGAGLAFGPDSASGSPYIYATTANGTFDNGVSNWGDSFLKLDPTTLTVPASNGYFTPADQFFRSDASCFHAMTASLSGDGDMGSGGVTLIPDNELAYPGNGYVSVSSEKEGGIWFVDRHLVATPPHLTACDGPPGICTCTTNDTNIIQSYWIGPAHNKNDDYIVHNNVAYWESDSATYPTKPYVYVAPTSLSNSTAGYLYQYALCASATDPNPICGTTYTNRATLSTGSFGITPTISAASSTDTDAIVWAIEKTDTSCPESDKCPHAVPNGVLFAFDAVTMLRLYSSGTCTSRDLIHQATKYSVPTVANGYVYVGTQSDNVTNKGKGTFYIFGPGATGTC